MGHERPTLRCPLDVRLSRERTFRYSSLSNSGSLAMFAAMRRASSRVRSYDCRGH
jgi:hypothetical protein